MWYTSPHQLIICATFSIAKDFWVSLSDLAIIRTPFDVLSLLGESNAPRGTYIELNQLRPTSYCRSGSLPFRGLNPPRTDSDNNQNLIYVTLSPSPEVTSILSICSTSRSWRNLWGLFPSLNFDCPSFAMGHSNPFRSKSALHNLIVRGIADQLKPPIDRIVVLLAPSGGLGFNV